MERKQHIKLFFKTFWICFSLVFCSLVISQPIQLLCEKPIKDFDRKNYIKNVSKTERNILASRCADPPKFDLFGANARRCERLQEKLQDLKNCSRAYATDTYEMNIDISALDGDEILSTDFQINHCMSNWQRQNCARMNKMCKGTFLLSHTPNFLSFYLPQSAHQDARFNVDRATMSAGWDLKRNFICRTHTSEQ